MKAASATPDRAVDLQSVLRAIARTAAQVCEANDALIILLMEGDRAAVVARHGRLPTRHKVGETYPLTDDMVGNRVMTERRTIHLRDLRKAPRGRFIGSKAAHLPLGVRTMLVTPLLRNGNVIGAIGIRRRKVQPFTRRQVALLKTFANQAAIAIENARLSQELQTRNVELTEALEQQTATSEILRVIAGSPADLQPALDAVTKSAARLCESLDAVILRRESDRLVLCAHYGPISVGPTGEFSLPLGRDTASGRAVLDGITIHAADMQTEDKEFPTGSNHARTMGHRTILHVPLLRDGVAIGTIGVRRTEARRFTERQVSLLQTFADQAVIAIENVRLFNETKEALERQTATSEILRVISSSPTDLQPVMDAVAENAARVCGATDATIRRIEGNALRLVARFGSIPFVAPDLIPISRNYPTGMSVIERRTIHIEDILPRLETEFPGISRELRTVLATPLLREGIPIGAIVIRRAEVQPFTDAQIALLQTFADQAVIAIENVRLFNETKEALERQTATSEILRVIASSPTDIQPVFDGVVQSAARLCGAADVQLLLVRGDVLELAAAHGSFETARTRPIRRSLVAGRAIVDQKPVHVPDIELERDQFPEAGLGSPPGRQPARTLLAMPLLREGTSIGVIQAVRIAVRPFADQQIALLQTFADQAVIAIENVRLFKELDARNRDLTTALDQQTATSEILQVISRSQTDVQPVFDTIVGSAVRLLRGHTGALTRIVGGEIALAAVTSLGEAMDAQFRSGFPMALDRNHPHPRAIRERAVINIVDTESDLRLPDRSRELARTRGFRSWVTVPMLRRDQALGTIAVTRSEAGGFSEDEIELLKTFADQAVIAIENVRLFKELEARTQALTRSVSELRALGEVGQAISSTLDLQTVLRTIVARATQLAGVDAGVIYEYDEQGEVFVPRATRAS